jgi:predicted amidophosphoribosyltransferase
LICPARHDNTYAFERARRFALYEGALVKAILVLKFEQIQPFRSMVRRTMAEVMRDEGKLLGADVVAPVPYIARGKRNAATARRR